MKSIHPLLGLAVVLAAVSLFFHMSIALDLYHPPLALSFPLTIAMLLAWMDGSKRIKELAESEPAVNPWKIAWRLWPQWFKYLIVFIAVYAVLNFGYVLATSAEGSGWVDLTPGYKKLRGVSAFWLMFYIFEAGTFLLAKEPAD